MRQRWTRSSAAIADNAREKIGACLSDKWLDDTTIAGPASRVRDEVERWYKAGISHTNSRTQFGQRWADAGL